MKDAWWDDTYRSCVKVRTGVGTFYTERSSQEPLVLPGRQPDEFKYDPDEAMSTRGYWQASSNGDRAKKLGCTATVKKYRKGRWVMVTQPVAPPCPQRHTNWWTSAGCDRRPGRPGCPPPALSCSDTRSCPSAHEAPRTWPRDSSWAAHQELWTYLRLELVKVPVRDWTETDTTTAPTGGVQLELRPVSVRTTGVPGGVVPVGGALRPTYLSATATLMCDVYKDGSAVPAGPTGPCASLAAGGGAARGLPAAALAAAAPRVVQGSLSTELGGDLVACTAGTSACDYRATTVPATGAFRSKVRIEAFRASPPGSALLATAQGRWTVSWNRVITPPCDEVATWTRKGHQDAAGNVTYTPWELSGTQPCKSGGVATATAGTKVLTSAPVTGRYVLVGAVSGG